MHIITVSGSKSGAGKTTLGVLLASRLTGFAAIKVSIAGFYTTVTDDPGVIEKTGKDTALLKAAGAEPVVFVQCPREDLSEALSQALGIIGGARGVIIEGDSPARAVRPDTRFFVTGEDLSEIRPENMELLSSADVVVVNIESGEVPAEFMEQIRAHNRSGAVTTMGRMRAGGEPFDGFIKALSV